MAKITQKDINDIAKIQVQITPVYHIIHEVEEEQVTEMLSELTYLKEMSQDELRQYLVKQNQRIIGVDTIALLQKQYDVADASQLLFQNCQLGGVLLKDARAVLFDKCDFTHCHVLNNDTHAFIRTNHEQMNDFTSAKFFSCDLHEVLFKNVNLNKATFANTKLSATQFLYSDLANCEFESITFSRAPRFVHTNLYHSHAHLHSEEHARNSQLYDKTALVGGLLISASALLITFMMFDVMPAKTVISMLSVGLLISGVILGYLGAATSSKEKSIAERYELFEHAVDSNSEKQRDVQDEREQQRRRAS